MRKVRDYDQELSALAERASQLNRPMTKSVFA